jgi:beta-fructofuranosidase
MKSTGILLAAALTALSFTGMRTATAADAGVAPFAPETPVMPENPPDTWLTYHLAHPGPGGAVPADPNCAIFHKGRYHLHYIYQSQGHSYAHVSSTDMVHWKWHPTVLTPPKTGHNVISGTAFLTKDGTPAIIYHGQGSGRNQIAFALDDDLDKWSKTIAVDPRTASGEAPAMRHWDPDCWCVGDTYYALSGGENPTLARSSDLKQWEFLGELFHPDFPADLGIPKGEDTSCANMFRIGNKWMLLGISHTLGARYYLGDFKDERFLPEHHALLNWSDLDLFAPESLLTPDGRRVMWAWCPLLSQVQERPEKKDLFALLGGKLQAGIQSLPRELSLPEDGVLRIKPLRELEQLRTDPKQERDIIVKSGAAHMLKGITGDAMELEITLAAPTAREYGVKVLCDKDGNGGFTIAFGAASKALTVGYVNPPFELTDGEDLTLRVFIDKNLIEVFANDRQAAIAWHEYDPKDLHVSVFSEGAAMRVKSVDAWRMKSIYSGQ